MYCPTARGVHRFTVAVFVFILGGNLFFFKIESCRQNGGQLEKRGDPLACGSFSSTKGPRKSHYNPDSPNRGGRRGGCPEALGGHFI